MGLPDPFSLRVALVNHIHLSFLISETSPMPGLPIDTHPYLATMLPVMI